VKQRDRWQWLWQTPTSLQQAGSWPATGAGFRLPNVCLTPSLELSSPDAKLYSTPSFGFDAASAAPTFSEPD
jgi:hypothetical protein